MFTAIFLWCVFWFCLSEMAWNGHQIGSVGVPCLEKPCQGHLWLHQKPCCLGAQRQLPWSWLKSQPFYFMVMTWGWLWFMVMVMKLGLPQYYIHLYTLLIFVILCLGLRTSINQPFFLLCENQEIPGWPRRSCISLTKIGACAHVRCKRYELRSGALWWENDGNHGGQYGLMRFNRDILCIIHIYIYIV